MWFSSNLYSIWCALVAEQTSAVNENDMRVGKPTHSVILVGELRSTSWTLRIRAGLEVTTAWASRQSGGDTLKNLRCLLAPSRLLVSLSVNRVGATVAVKMRPAVTHTARPPCTDDLMT